MKIDALEDLFLQELCELYDAEKRIVHALPHMAKAASNVELRAAFETHQKQTKTHISRLEKIFKTLGEKLVRVRSEAVVGLIDQGAEMAGKRAGDPAVVDAGLITTAQKIEHYEIAGYGCVRTHATILGYGEVADMLAETLKEEEETDRLLTGIANKSVNRRAAQAPYAQARTMPRQTEDASEAEGGGIGNLLFGLGVGAALAFLFAPNSGSETRDHLLAKANEGKDFLKRQGDRMSSSTNDLVARSRQAIAQYQDRWEASDLESSPEIRPENSRF